ncbi:60S ribosomal protein L7-like 1 [Callorhinchus milii]|nr:60S ribosomal protein L7-like 1 [Callorhinchus milii]AFM90669.1 60S ribosomal protein L7-like 1 [Callorhinchus milii]|eukprot:gi/632989740/ref/XP_007883811.1/ PREDICTED: 60S ribosomal protein L7-like 1 [Callorhinchus milii]
MAETESRKLLLVPENLLKKRRRYQAIKATEARRALEEKRKVQRGKQIRFKRVENFVRDSRRKYRDEIRLIRLSKKPGDTAIPSGQKLVFAVRIREIHGISPRVRNVIQMLRLRQLFSGTFVRLNPTSVKMLQMVEPYVAWGSPNLKSVRELILKRGQAKVNKKRVPLTNNAVIEQHLGVHGMICLEDLIHELYSVGRHFKEACNFLWPFKLSVARHAARNRVGFLKEFGGTGDRGEEINKLIRQLN